MKRPINYSTVRNLAMEVAVTAAVLEDVTQRLDITFVTLREELAFADPLKDQELEQFVLRLRRVIGRLRVDPDLAQVARRMQEFIPQPEHCNPAALEVAHA